jgi:hypothetical protein
VYSDRTRGELQVAKNNFFCSAYIEPITYIAKVQIV